MKSAKNISVAMATYNGEKYIKEQIDSILIQLGKEDEIVISDDGSTDLTIQFINSYGDSRIKLIDGPKKGLIKNFENAILNCKNDYIFLSDQDDIWLKNKKEEILKCFDSKNCILVIHDCIVFNSSNNDIILNSFFDFRKSRQGIKKNIIKNSYIGCCMAFDKKLIKKILPFPKNIPMHDQWIGLISEKNGKVVFLNKKLVKYRRHEKNITGLKHSNIIKMLINRINITINIIKR